MKKSNNTFISSNSQNKIICPICNKEFTLKEKYMIAGGYACKWKCFLKEVKRQKSEKIITIRDRNNKHKKK